MSVDPSSIPSFGGQQQPQQPAAKKPLGPIKPDADLVKQLLDQMKLKYVVDKEGDLVAPWENFRTYFMFRGEKAQRIFSVRTFYDRKHDIEEKPRLLEVINEWNRRTLWPKVYTHTHDDGTVRLIGEIQMLIGTGVALDHYVSSTVSWIRASIEFDKWLVQELGLAQDADEAEGGGAGEVTNGADVSDTEVGPTAAKDDTATDTGDVSGEEGDTPRRDG
ncbi:YbjN domain-containing protein [Streptomyces sp. ventii]|uniref:YbjN domain-containing protein n=1 Tax=Streptomyces spiramenti TaxID=2720606 RepID=A0ABX1ARR5_9ACTN|nr:YbjN domain-containing protein [Streptomyces spiramenti]